MEPLHRPGDRVGDRYTIHSLLGQGSTGSTYAADDLISQQRVAVKALSLRQITDWKVLELFEREARILETLTHPSIPAYLNHFHVDLPDDRRFYLVQELVEGRSLAACVERGDHFSEQAVERIAVRLLEILTYLHAFYPPVIHRDIKPQNVIYRPDERVFLVDFSAVQQVYYQTITRGATFVGTIGYMPPEQFRGQVQPTADLYSLGATLLFLLTHQSPDTFPQRRMKIEFRPQVNLPPLFADWLEKMLEPAVEDRFPSAEAALAVLVGEGAIAAAHQPIDLKLSPFPAPYTCSLPDSNIVLDRTAQRLTLTIPARSFAGIFLVLGGVVATACLGFVGLIYLGCVLYSSVVTTCLSIDDRFFTVSHRLFGITFWRYPGLTADLELMNAENVRPSQKLAFRHKRRIHSFGRPLRRAEQRWLMAELSDFLAQLRSNP